MESGYVFWSHIQALHIRRAADCMRSMPLDARAASTLKEKYIYNLCERISNRFTVWRREA